MASRTKVVKMRRLLKKAGLAKRKKNWVRKYGSTPKLLPLNKPNANESTMKKQA